MQHERVCIETTVSAMSGEIHSRMKQSSDAITGHIDYVSKVLLVLRATCESMSRWAGSR